MEVVYSMEAVLAWMPSRAYKGQSILMFVSGA